MRLDILERETEIREWIDQNQSKAYMCRQLRCKPETLNSYLEKMGISYKGNMGGKGIKSDPKYKTAKEYVNCGSAVKSHKLKKKLIRDGLKKSCCEICGVSKWQDKKIPLELHHIDCNRFNNKLDNLMILCPNCHSVQPGNSGRNIGSYNS